MTNARILILIFGTLALSGAPVSEAAAADSSAVKMSMSANENYLRRFRKEREALASAADPESVKKRDGLDKKIKHLELENERLTAMLQKSNPKPAASAPASAPPAAAPAPLPVPASAPVDMPAPKRVAEPPPASRARPVGAAVVEWEKMTREEKESYILKIVTGLKKDGYPVERHPLFYTALMDYVFVSDAALAVKPLKEAVLATIQKNETSWRALQKQ